MLAYFKLIQFGCQAPFNPDPRVKLTLFHRFLWGNETTSSVLFGILEALAIEFECFTDRYTLKWPPTTKLYVLFLALLFAH